MLSNINYRLVAEGAILAIAIGPTLPTGILATVGVLACATLGNFCIDFISKKNQEPIKAQQVSEMLEKSLVKVRDLKSYKLHLKIAGVKVEEEMEYWSENIKKHGLFDLQNGDSLKEREEIILKIILQNLYISMYVKESYIDESFILKKRMICLENAENKFEKKQFSIKENQVKETTKCWLRKDSSKEWENKIRFFESNALNDIRCNESLFDQSIIPSNSKSIISFNEYKSHKLKKYEEEKVRLNAIAPPHFYMS